jgi:hypothetical protein
MTTTSIGLRKPSNMVPRLARARLFARLTSIALPLAIMNGDVALSYFACFGNTPSSGKIVSTCPSALSLFA